MIVYIILKISHPRNPLNSSSTSLISGNKNFCTNKKKRGPYFVCGKMRYLARVCKFHKDKNEEASDLE